MKLAHDQAQVPCGNRMFEKLFERGGLSLERLHALILLADEGTLIRAAKGDSGLQRVLAEWRFLKP